MDEMKKDHPIFSPFSVNSFNDKKNTISPIIIRIRVDWFNWSGPNIHNNQQQQIGQTHTQKLNVPCFPSSLFYSPFPGSNFIKASL
jgi:hypothetical protein